MLNFDELDKKFIVEYDEHKTCMFAYLWNKKEFPNTDFSEKGWLSVSDAYGKCLEHKWHFYPTGWYRDTHIAGYELNKTFGDCTDTTRTLYIVGKINGKPWEEVSSIGDVVDTDLFTVNRERRLVNFMLGYVGSDKIRQEDCLVQDKSVLVKSLLSEKNYVETIMKD